MTSKKLIRIFTPSHADLANTNAQNLSTKEIVARLDSGRFHVSMISMGEPDPRISARRNTRLVPWTARGNTMRLLGGLVTSPPDIYFFPRTDFLDEAFLMLRRICMRRVRLVTYVVATQDMGQPEDRSTASARRHSRGILEADAVIGNSAYVTRTLEQQYEVAAQTIHSGIDARHFYPEVRAAGKAGRLSVLFAGSFQARKRPDLVIRQAARWPGVDFSLAGQGEEMDACRALARRLGCNNVEFLGHLSPAALGSAMRQADIFFFPSLIEGHPQVLGQAAACGLPCVAMNCYHPDYVLHGETGLLAETDEEAGRALDRLLLDPVWRRKAGEQAVIHARRFDWDQIAKHWTTLFERVVEQ